tara:strand:- start:281 stop:532 length:252 start_codon:yes stop_codon:yes gene_type:complete
VQALIPYVQQTLTQVLPLVSSTALSVSTTFKLAVKNNNLRELRHFKRKLTQARIFKTIGIRRWFFIPDVSSSVPKSSSKNDEK